jgi:hypothetical protein
VILSAGKIIKVFCVFAKPKPKLKYAVCICPVARLFFLINSEPRRTSLDAQVLIAKNDFKFLKQDSYINAATICVFPEKEIDLGSEIDFITIALKAEIIKVTQECKYHSLSNKELIAKNFSSC